MPAPTRRLTAALTAVALTAIGCDTGSTEPAGAAPPATDDTDAPVVEVELVDYEFVGLPETVAAGTRFEVANRSEAELHELVAFALDEGAPAVEDLLALPPEELEAELGAPATVLLAAPGSDEAIVPVGDGTLAEPGRYAILCVIPTGADPQEYLDAAATSDGPPQVDGGPPHIAQGMYAEVVVG